MLGMWAQPCAAIGLVWIEATNRKLENEAPPS